MDLVNKEINCSIQLLKEAINSVQNSYYIIETIEGKKIRERVFCYELYHQMRKIQEKLEVDFNLIINGELDKIGNDIFNNEKPDFVFHIPGNMKDNTLVIEVKGQYDKDQVKKDFEKLNRFTKYYNYKKGLFLIYTLSKYEFISKIKQHKDLFIEYTYNKNIIILCKKDYDSKIEEIYLSEILK